jgi:hypothetical protein
MDAVPAYHPEDAVQQLAVCRKNYGVPLTLCATSLTTCTDMIEEADQLSPTTPIRTLILLRDSPAQYLQATSFDSIIQLRGAGTRRLQA